MRVTTILIFCVYYLLSLKYDSVEGTFRNNVTFDSLQIGTEGVYPINDTLERIVHITELPCSLEKRPPRVKVSCESCSPSNPVLVSVRMPLVVISWQLPMALSASLASFRQIEKTLCPRDVLGNTTCQNGNSNELSVSLSTTSPTPVEVKFLVTLENDLQIHVGDRRNLSVRLAAPSYLMYEFPKSDESLDTVFLRVESNDDLCMVVSVQHIDCPIYDLENNVQFDGSFQSMTRSAGLTISRNEFQDGFYVVFIVNTDDKLCVSPKARSTDRVKNISVTLTPTIEYGDYAIAFSAVILVMLFICVGVYIALYIYMRRLPNIYKEVPQPTSEDLVDHTHHPFFNRSTYSKYPLDETDTQRTRLKTDVFLKDLSKNDPYYLNKKTEVYLWFLLIVALFYFLPVVQLVITYQKTLVTTGDQNLCYYNFLCAHPLGYLSDFNHVISNAGYVLMGIGLLFIVYKRQTYHLDAVRETNNIAIEQFYGIPQHFGLFYALGVALIVEGLFSACYHVCPNSYNFQFDTSFMYIISTMCMMKIYHTRHPDVSASAWVTFGILAGAILLGMLGVL